MPEHLYHFHDSSAKGSVWLSSPDGFDAYIVINCTVCKTRGLMRLPRNKKPRVGLYVTKPGTLDDIDSLGGMYAVSAKVQEAVRRAKLKGAVFVPPAVITTKGKGPRWSKTVKDLKDWGVKIMWVRGKGGTIRHTNKVRMTMNCGACGWIAWSQPRGPIKVDRKLWDGSDIFQVDEYTPILITQRASDVLADAGLTNYGKPRIAGRFV